MSEGIPEDREFTLFTIKEMNYDGCEKVC